MGLITNMCKKKNFTLIELLVVVIVIGVLASIAAPSFLNTQRKAKDREARSQLKLIYTAEKNQKLNTGNYQSCDSTQDCSDKLQLALPNAWDYEVNVTAGPPQTFTATAENGGGTDDWQIDYNDSCAWGISSSDYATDCKVANP